MEKMYDSVLKNENKGCMTLITPKYFEFGKELMERVSKDITQHAMKADGSEMVEKVLAKVKNNIELKKMFLNLSEAFSELDDAEKLDMHCKLVDIVVNTKVGDECSEWRKINSARGTKSNPTGSNFRTTQKNYTKRGGKSRKRKGHQKEKVEKKKTKEKESK